MDLLTKYNLLFEKASSPKSIDVGRMAIYQYSHYCKGCGEGLMIPTQSKGRRARGLYQRGYCSDECRGDKSKSKSNSNCIVKETRGFKDRITQIEKAAFAGIELARWMQSLQKIDKMIIFAESRFRLLSEKLSFLESITNKPWGSSLYYYRLNRIR